jgi:hypothetical protein
MTIWGSGIQYLVVCGPAQSNGPMEGRGTGTATAVTAPRAYVHRYDGNVVAATDPAGGNTNNRYATSVHAGVNSYTPALLNALWAGGSGVYGANDSIIMTGMALGGTVTSGWAGSAGAVPPVANSLYGIWELRLRDLIRSLPNPKVLCMIADIGESDATSTVTAPNWDPGMTTCVDAMLTFLTTTMGLSWAKSLRILLRILPDLAATGFTGWSPPATPCVQDAQIAWAAARNGVSPNSVVTYKPPGGLTYVAADNLHFQTASLDTIGTDVGAAIVAAS